MAAVDDTLAAAIQFHRDGELEKASHIYRQILRVDPEQAEALNLLGVLSMQQREPQQAVRYFHAATNADPTQACFHHHLGSALLQLEKTAEATASLQRAGDLEPLNPDVQFKLAVAYETQLDLGQAALSYHNVLALQPGNLAARTGLSRTYERLGEHDKAAEVIEQMLELDAIDVESINQLACLRFRQGHLDEAASLFKRALEISPQSTTSWLNLGSAFVASRQLAESEKCFRRVTQIDEENSDAWLNLSNVLKVQHRVDEAAVAYREAAQRLPGNPMRDLWPATLCPVVFSDNTAIDRYRRQLQSTICEFSRRRVSIEFDDIGALASTPPINLQYHGRDNRAFLEAYACMFQEALPENPPNATRRGRPRIGFVVTSGHESIFLRFFGAVLDRLTTGHFDCVVICHETGVAALRQRLGANSVQLLPIPYQFSQAVERIRTVGFDVLYHWETVTDVTNYFLPFCRLAPVQCTSVGNAETSGNAAIDYFISSSLYEPLNGRAHYTEELILLDGLGSLDSRARRPDKFRSREAFGFSANQHIYACAQKLQKIHPDFDAPLAEILRRDSRGIVVLVDNEFPAPATELRRRFRSSIPDVADRVHFIPKLEFNDYLSLLAAADVLLDPLHYGGGLTTHDALSLCRPVVTLPGQFARGRYTLGLYQKMGINSLVADSPQHYVELAVQVASEPDLRKSIETDLRNRSSAVFDDQNIVNQYQQIFEQLVTESRSD